MKNESLSKLNLISDLVEFPIPQETAKHIKELVYEIICEETKNRRSKKVGFDIYDYVLSEKSPYYYSQRERSAVYHKNGYKIATSGSILVGIKEDYKKEDEGKLLTKYGGCVCGKFPKYKSIIPTDKNLIDNYNQVKINVDEIEKKIDTWKNEVRCKYKAANKRVDWSDKFCVGFGGKMYALKNFILYLRAIKKIEADTLFVPKSNENAKEYIYANTANGFCLLCDCVGNYDNEKYLKID